MVTSFFAIKRQRTFILGVVGSILLISAFTTVPAQSHAAGRDSVLDEQRYEAELDRLAEARKIARTRFPVGPEADSVIDNLALVASGRARSPTVEWYVGFSGSGKTTGVRETLDIAGVDPQRIIFRRVEAGDIVFDFGPLYRMTPNVSGKLMAVVGIDEILSLGPWTQLIGQPPPEPPPTKWSHDDDGEGERLRDSRVDRERLHANPVRRAPSAPKVLNKLEELMTGFYQTEKGRRIRMWMDLQDILGSGSLNIPLDEISKKLGDSYGGKLLNPLESLYERLDDYDRAKRNIVDSERREKRYKREQVLLANPIAALLAEIQGPLNINLQSRNSEAQRANQKYDLAVEASIANVSGSSRPDDSDSSGVGGGVLRELLRAQQEAKTKVEMAVAEINRKNAEYQKASSRLAELTQSCYTERSAIERETQKLEEALAKVTKAVETILELDQDYFRKLGLDPSFGAERLVEDLKKNARSHVSRIAQIGVSMPRVFSVNFVNTIFYFIGNPPNLLRELKQRFVGINPKTPDALRKMVLDDADLNNRLRIEIASILGLDDQVLRNDPDIPDQLKPIILQKVDALLDRMGINGIKFKLPPSNEEYETYLRSWIESLRLSLIKLNRNEVTLTIDPASWEILFKAVVDPLGQLRRTWENYLQVMRRIDTQLSFMMRLASRDRVPANIHLSFHDLENDLRAEIELRGAAGEPARERWSQTFIKPLMSWQLEDWASLKTSDQLAYQQAAQIVLGLYHFRSMPGTEIGPSLHLEQDIDRKIWRNTEGDVVIALGQVGTLVAGPLMELSSGRPEQILKLSTSGRNQLAVAKSAIGHLVELMRTSEFDYVSLFGGVPNSEREAKLRILNQALDLPVDQPNQLNSEQIFELIREKTARIIGDNFALVTQIADELRSGNLVTQSVIVQILKKLSEPQRSEPIDARSLYSPETIALIESSKPGIITANPNAKLGWLNRTCEETLTAQSALISRTNEAPRPAEANHDPVSGVIQGPTLRHVMDEVHGLYLDLRGIFD